MATAHLPVLPGFHVTTHAYRRLIDEDNLGNPILSFAAQAKAGDPVDTARATGYRARQKIPPEDVALAVVVQQLTAADAAD